MAGNYTFPVASRVEFQRFGWILCATVPRVTSAIQSNARLISGNGRALGVHGRWAHAKPVPSLLGSDELPARADGVTGDRANVHDAARWLRPLRLWDADRDRSGRDIRHALT